MTGRTLTARPRPPKPEPAPPPAPLPTSKGNQNLQDQFLNLLRKNKVPVTMFLVKGVKLQGIVTWFDNFSILLRRDGQSQLVYKHAISTIMPGLSLDPAQFSSHPTTRPSITPTRRGTSMPRSYAAYFGRSPGRYRMPSSSATRSWSPS